MAAAKMLRLQTANPYKRNPQCPNRFRPVGTPPAQRVNFARTTSTELKSSSSPLQYRCPAQKPLPSHCPPTQEQEQEPFFFNKVLRFLVKLTASVALGALLLLTHKPKPALAAPAGRICAISQTVDTLDEEDVTRYDAAKEINVFRVIAETIFFVLSECLLFFVLAGMLRMLRIWPISLQPSTIDVIQDKIVGFFMIMVLPYAVFATVRHYNPSTVVKLHLQLNGSGRALQTELERIAETAQDTSSTFKGVDSILKEITANILNHPECYITGSVSVSSTSLIT